jgi:hypothetical protein
MRALVVSILLVCGCEFVIGSETRAYAPSDGGSAETGDDTAPDAPATPVDASHRCSPARCFDAAQVCVMDCTDEGGPSSSGKPSCLSRCAADCEACIGDAGCGSKDDCAKAAHEQ